MPSAGSASASVSAQAQDDQHIDAAVPVEPDEPALTSYPPERVYRTSSSPSSPSRTAQLNPQSAVLDHSASTSSSTSAPGWQNNGSTAGHDDEPGQDNVKQSRRSMQIFGTPQVGIIGHHKPREIVRIERDYTAGETCQFWSGFPLELEGRISPADHLRTLNELNTILANAFDPYKSIFDNILAIFTLYLSTLVLSSHYDQAMSQLEDAIKSANINTYNVRGLTILSPRPNAYLFLEVEYY